ncbi:AN1-type zinc finger protein 2A, partial [Kappamyces sp. JEL0680]
MELPHLGKPCFSKDCRELNDFLLQKCVYCSHEFCATHAKAREEETPSDGHHCKSIPLDARAVVCPVCKQVVPVAKGDSADAVVSAHISRNCPKEENERVYVNQCSMRGCKKKELMPIKCNVCLLNFCLKHRLE